LPQVVAARDNLGFNSGLQQRAKPSFARFFARIPSVLRKKLDDGATALSKNATNIFGNLLAGMLI
jgi:hypothetical protein